MPSSAMTRSVGPTRHGVVDVSVDERSFGGLVAEVPVPQVADRGERPVAVDQGEHRVCIFALQEDDADPALLWFSRWPGGIGVVRSRDAVILRLPHPGDVEAHPWLQSGSSEGRCAGSHAAAQGERGGGECLRLLADESARLAGRLDRGLFDRRDGDVEFVDVSGRRC